MKKIDLLRQKAKLFIVLTAALLLLKTQCAIGQDNKENLEANHKLENNIMATKIQLNVKHNDKTRAEYFIQALNEDFELLPLDWKSWKESERIVDAVKLTNTDKSLTITLLFLEDYYDADIIAKANALPTSDTARWSNNGSLMFLVESPDSSKVDNALSIIAGKE